MNIDAALRYEPILKEITQKKINEPILEVGSGTNGIAEFYEGEVIGYDSDFSKTETTKKKNIIHKTGSIQKIPFAENKFPVVVCLDTFEHLPKGLRIKSLEELIRVTKKGGVIYLGFPTGSLSSHAEKLIQKLYLLTHKKKHLWLKEHEENGLPDLKLILSQTKEKKVEKIKIIPNVNLFSWFFVHWFFTVNEGNFLGKVGDRLKLPIFNISKIVNFPPYYRAILVIEK